MGIVDEHHHRALLGKGRQQAERRGADRKPVLLATRTQRERGLERHRLRPRNPPHCAQGRAKELEQRPERDLRLRLDPARAQQPHPGRALGGVVQQRRLADPGVAAERQHGAGARSRPLESKLDVPLLLEPTEQHSAILRGPVPDARLIGDRKD